MAVNSRWALAATLALLALPGTSTAQQSGAASAANSDQISAKMAELLSDTPAPTPKNSARPVAYMPLVKQWLQSYLRDPYSAVVTEVRGPRSTSFKPDVWTKVTGTAVCYDINAKNAYGGYTGVKRHLFIFDADRVAYHVSTADERDNSLAPMLVQSECGRPAGS